MADYINIIKIIVLLTFIHGFLKLDKSKKVNLIVLAILSLNLFNEVLSSVLRYCAIQLKLTSSCYIILHTMLWLHLLGMVSGRKKTEKTVLFIFAVFAVTNALWIDGLQNFNAYTMIVGAFLYVLFFTADCYLRLKSETLHHFSSNEYILTAAPLLFFIGFSILFGFRHRILHQTEWHGITLFVAVSYFINIIYYALLNIYIHKTNKATINDQ